MLLAILVLQSISVHEPTVSNPLVFMILLIKKMTNMAFFCVNRSCSLSFAACLFSQSLVFL